jgi:hypothetical protein
LSKTPNLKPSFGSVNIYSGPLQPGNSQSTETEVKTPLAKPSPPYLYGTFPFMK